MRTITVEITLWEDSDQKENGVLNAISRDARVVTVNRLDGEQR